MSACTGSYWIVTDGIDMLARVEADDLRRPDPGLWSVARLCPFRYQMISTIHALMPHVNQKKKKQVVPYLFTLCLNGHSPHRLPKSDIQAPHPSHYLQTHRQFESLSSD